MSETPRTDETIVLTHYWRGDPLFEFYNEPIPRGESWSVLWHKVPADPPYYQSCGLVSNHEDTVFYANLDDEI